MYREYGEYLVPIERKLRRETQTERDIEWLGPLGPEELYALLCRSGYLPYLANCEESFCLSVLEAQSAGCLPIVTPMGALSERVVQGETGWVQPSWYF